MIPTLALSLLIGLLLGLLGGGGSILTVPMLVYVMHTEPKTAIATSFVVVGISSLIAIIQHARKKHVCWKSGVFFGLSGMTGAFGGGRMAAYFSSDLLMALFGLVTLVTGIAMLRVRKQDTDRQAVRERIAFCPTKVPYLRLLFDGVLVGALTGLVGVGGGFLIVPALTLLVKLPMPAAVGTSLLVIAMNATAGFAGYINHASIDVPLTAIVTGGAIAGSVLGGWLSTRTRATVLRRLFGLFVLVIAGYVLFQSLSMQLMRTVAEWLEQHVQFMLGIGALAVVLLLLRIGAWIHRAAPDDTTSGMKPRFGPDIR